jgi:hypothetical protein
MELVAVIAAITVSASLTAALSIRRDRKAERATLDSLDRSSRGV